MSRSILFSLFCCSLFLSSCFSVKPVTFKHADSFSVKHVLSPSPEVYFEMVFENPNSYGCTIKSIETDGVLDGKNLLNYKTVEPLRAKGNSEFVVPVTIAMPRDKLLAVLPSAVRLFGNNEEVPFQLKGSITLKKFLFKKTFYFSMNEKNM